MHNRLKPKVERRYRTHTPSTSGFNRFNRDRTEIIIGNISSTDHDLPFVPLKLSSLPLFSRILHQLFFSFPTVRLINQLINSRTSGYKYNPLYYREIDLDNKKTSVRFKYQLLLPPRRNTVDKTAIRIKQRFTVYRKWYETRIKPRTLSAAKCVLIHIHESWDTHNHSNAYANRDRGKTSAKKRRFDKNEPPPKHIPTGIRFSSLSFPLLSFNFHGISFHL